MNIFEIDVESFYQGMTDPYDSEAEEQLAEDREVEFEHESNE